MSLFIRTVPNVMRHFGCSADDAQRYIDRRDEGYSTEQAALMAGLSDPSDSSPLSTSFCAAQHTPGSRRKVAHATIAADGSYFVTLACGHNARSSIRRTSYGHQLPAPRTVMCGECAAIAKATASAA